MFCIFCLSSLSLALISTETETEILERLDRLSARIQDLEDQTEAKDEKIGLLTQQLQHKAGLTHPAKFPQKSPEN